MSRRFNSPKRRNVTTVQLAEKKKYRSGSTHQKNIAAIQLAPNRNPNHFLFIEKPGLQAPSVWITGFVDCEHAMREGRVRCRGGGEGWNFGVLSKLL
jgi:hypothetical protein